MPDRINPLHQQDHLKLKDLLAGWDTQLGEDLTERKQQAVRSDASDLVRDNLLIHMGAYHGWTVAKDGGNIGLTPLLSEHDVVHGRDDLLGVEVILPENVQKAIAWDRDRLRKLSDG